MSTYRNYKSGQSSRAFTPACRFVSLRGQRFEASIRAELNGEKAKAAVRSVSLPKLSLQDASEKVKA